MIYFCLFFLEHPPHEHATESLRSVRTYHNILQRYHNITTCFMSRIFSLKLINENKYSNIEHIQHLVSISKYMQQDLGHQSQIPTLIFKHV